MTLHGIDVSKHQGAINWAMVKASGKVSFAILRAGYGRLTSQKDSMFESYYTSCKSVGIPVGAYWYSYAMTEEDARQEAQACIEVLKGKQFEYPIYFDVEESKTLALGKVMVSKIIRAFCETLEAAGYWVGLYMSKSPLITCVTPEVRARYVVWVAHYANKTDYAGQYGMWQKSSAGKIDGINGNVDLDECYEDYPTLIKSNGKNGYAIESATPVTPETKDVTLVIDGETWTGTLCKS